MEEALRSGIKDDTQEEIQVETSAEEKAVENFEEVAPRNGLMGGKPVSGASLGERGFEHIFSHPDFDDSLF